MARIRRIVVPTDFSPHSDQAMRYAVMIARAFKARIFLIHAIEPFTFEMTDVLNVVDHYAALKTIAKPLLDNAQKRFMQKGLPIQTGILSGPPYREILKEARRRGADLIVMGTHGRTGVERFLLGSVAERVVRLSPCPVVTVRSSVIGKVGRRARRPAGSGKKP